MKAVIHTHYILTTDPPVINPIDFGGTDLYEGGIATATCVVSQGSLPLIVTWTYNGNLFRNDEYRAIHNFGKRTSILTIEPLNHLHQGVYGCAASNAAGSYQVEAKLVIQGKTDLGFMKSMSMFGLTYNAKLAYGVPVTSGCG